ncbi:hypothetical protein [Campylobacter showae]|uniref:hypothetical protein n=1 Tax=Campylobacter showae TaxID=204 RepID=UPI003C6F09EB
MREYFASKPDTGRGKGYSISHPIRDMYGFKLEGELNFDNLTSYLGAGYSEDVFKWRGRRSRRNKGPNGRSRIKTARKKATATWAAWTWARAIAFGRWG